MRRSERVEPSEITNPFYAAFITSMVRAVVGEIMNAIPSNKMVFSVTTDGFLTNASEAEMEAAKNGPLCQRYRATREYLTGVGEVLSEKHAVRQILGWRTRGQATLIPGDDPDIEKQIVLAKAGIKSPVEATEPNEQNDHILRTFFGRTPQNPIEIDVHTSVREMIFYDADLVSKKLVRNVRMEYDMKRKPKAVALARVVDPSHPGDTVDHLAFSTDPWKDIETFRIVRKFWDDHWAKSPRCLKTIDDYVDFAEFFDMMRALPARDQKYMRQSKGSLMRLKRDICRAFKHGEAGLDQYQHLKAPEFASILNGCGMCEFGVEVKVSDVENGKRVEFKPNTTPNEAPVRKVLSRLKDAIPDLQVDLLVAPQSIDGINLLGAVNADCRFASLADCRDR